ncbi:hypothetical protein Tco_0944238 [Tanacetum coccineum]
MSLGQRNYIYMMSASVALSYTWEILRSVSIRCQGYIGDFVLDVMLKIWLHYVLGNSYVVNQGVTPAEEQPLPPVDSLTAESPEYVTESDPEEDREEYEDDETEDGPVDYPMDGEDDGDDDDGDSSEDDADGEDEDDEDEEEGHLAPADSAIVVSVDEPVFPPEGT